MVDLDRAAEDGVVNGVPSDLLTSGSLNALLDAGVGTWRALRQELRDALDGGQLDALRLPADGVEMRLPWTVADYVDFYSSLHHATNVGRMFRPDAEPLLPNWRHLPVGYHGRAGTVVVDGTPVRRPLGQRRGEDGPVFGPSTRLDVELELGLVLGGATEPGETVAVEDATDHVFGVVLLDDWSARDVQAWEYRPLGPFLGKSFLTSVSAWVLPWLALEEAGALVDGPAQDPAPLPHLARAQATAIRADLVFDLTPHEDGETRTVSTVDASANLYWTPAQQVAHLTSNGATIRPGDLLGSGTISGPEPDQRGCLLERTWNGTEPLDLGDGVTRTFLEDGDVARLRGDVVGADGTHLPLGPVTGRVLPA